MNRLSPALLFLCAAAFSQSQAIRVPPAAAGAAHPEPTIRQTVNNVLVDVVVTDKNGRPISGLSKDRFQLLENGAPQQIAYFEEHAVAAAAAAPIPQLNLPANVYSNFTGGQPDNGPTLVLLMDALNTPAGDQEKVRSAMLDYLRKIPQGRHIAVFTLGGKLQMIAGFNTDAASLTAALDQVAAWQKTHTRLTDEPGQDSFADFMRTYAQVDAAVIARFISHEQPMRMDTRVADTLNALEALGIYLSALPGRKNLIWFSSAFPITIGDGGNLEAARNYEGDLRKTAELLKLARVAVYPVDPGALATPGMLSVTSNHGGQNIAAEADSAIDSHETMDNLAEATGGRAFHSTTDLAGAITSIAGLASDYYTLAYVPRDSTYDGKYRKIAIKVDAGKAHLDYRRGYYAEDPDKAAGNGLPQASRTSWALLHGAPAATDILFKVRIAPTEAPNQPEQPGVVRYSVNWSVDLRGLNLTESSGGMRRGAVTLAVVAYNSDSKAINNVSTPVSLILEGDEYRLYLKSGLQFHQELDLPVGHVYLRAAIVDQDKDRAGAMEIPLNVSPLPAAAASTAH
jgi:VWFA-related protein